MEELKKVIDLAPLNDDEISKKNISLSSLWMVKDEQDKVFGPYDTEGLKVYISRYQYLFEKTKAYNLKSEQWSDTFAVSHFQRRKKDKNKATQVYTNEFYIQLNKQKSGPYSKDEIQTFLNNGQLTPKSPISTDRGKSWIKVFEYHAFDRRSLKTNQELPFRPDKDILEKVALTKEEIIKAKEQDDAIVELAYLGHQKGQKENSEGNSGLANSLFSITKGQKIALGSLVLATLTLSLALKFLGKLSEGDLSSYDKLSNSLPKQISPVQPKAPVKIQPIKAKPKIIVPKKMTKTPIRKPLPRPRKRLPKPRNRGGIARTLLPPPKKMDQKNEDIDINDPEVQEEISRQLSGDFDLDGDEKEEEEDFDDYNELEREDEYLGDEGAIDHSVDDY